MAALHQRFNDAKQQAKAINCILEFQTFLDLLKEVSFVTINMPISVALHLVNDPNYLYQNYESLVATGIRRPAVSRDDRHRFAVSGALFGANAKEIVYGALSLSRNGLPAYGPICAGLRRIAVENRTTFIECNSYDFVDEHSLGSGDQIPLGYIADWDTKHELALAKHVSDLSPGSNRSDFQAILIRTDGINRENDDFIEAHIFGKFDKNAIDFMVIATDEELSRGDKACVDAVLSRFERIRNRAI